MKTIAQANFNVSVQDFKEYFRQRKEKEAKWRVLAERLRAQLCEEFVPGDSDWCSRTGNCACMLFEEAAVAIGALLPEAE